MTYRIPGFNFVERGFKKNILLLPGWATDRKIFERLDIPFNYLLPGRIIMPGDYEDIVAGLPEEVRSTGLAILGWSMGGFMAADLVCRYPGLFDRAILVSVRQHYTSGEIAHARDCLKKNARAYLYKFYGNLFSRAEEEHKAWFKGCLLKEYLENTGALRLLEGLDYLAAHRLDAGSLDSPNIVIVHGEDDTIAPFSDAARTAGAMRKARFIVIKGGCHFPLLKKEFTDWIKEL